MQLNKTAKVLVGLGIFFLPFIAMPVYFYIYIWLETPPKWALQPTVSLPAQT